MSATSLFCCSSFKMANSDQLLLAAYAEAAAVDISFAMFIAAVVLGQNEAKTVTLMFKSQHTEC